MGQEQLIQRLMTADEFYLWLASQSEKYELVDGQPRLMARASIAHDTIVMNASRIIGNQLLGNPCRPRSADVAIKVSDYQIRYPDLSVDSGMPNSSSREAGKPTLVVEVESESTGVFDAVGKLEEYKSVASIEYILLVSTKNARILFFFRTDNGAWSSQVIKGLESQIVMPLIHLTLSLADLYYDLQFDSEQK
jgi:Uma2 family endonuclease